MENCDMRNEKDIRCSVIVPVYNEAKIVGELYDRLTRVMQEARVVLFTELQMVELIGTF